MIVPAYNQSELLVQALDSVAAGEYADLELVVVDDCSTDLTGDVAERWMLAHPQIPSLLLRHPINRGLPATRNTAIAHSHGELVLPLDSDNELLPNCLSRLTEALDREPGAAFAYGILQGVGGDGPERVMGYYGWEPERLAQGNYIDALALIRRDALEQVAATATSQPSMAGRTTICGASSRSGGCMGHTCGSSSPVTGSARRR